MGDVTVQRDGRSLAVAKAPEGVRSAQTFYYSWSAFYPETEVIAE